MKHPKVSIVTANKNGAVFLEETIDSIRSQSYKNIEHIIVDGCSSDSSLEIISRYASVRLISEPDKGPNEAFAKGFLAATGELIMVMCVSDVYLSKTWVERCVEVLEREPHVSLVWGLGMNMNEAGDIFQVWQHRLEITSPPQKENFFPYWVGVAAHIPELNYCVRKNVYLECFFGENLPSLARVDSFLNFLYEFNRRGYLPKFVPNYAHCGRIHKGQLSETCRKDLDSARLLYLKSARLYLCDLILRRHTHTFRAGCGEAIATLGRKALLLVTLKAVHYYIQDKLNKPNVVGRVIYKLLKSLIK